MNRWTDRRSNSLGLGAIPIVNFDRVLRAINSLTERFIMYLNGIKHNVVTNLNPFTRNVGPDRRTMYDGRRLITIAHPEPSAQES